MIQIQILKYRNPRLL